jgi:hypothetical protein
VWEYLTDGGLLRCEPAGGSVTAGPGPGESMRELIAGQEQALFK